VKVAWKRQNEIVPVKAIVPVLPLVAAPGVAEAIPLPLAPAKFPVPPVIT
jgi:hypothetical protein